MEKFNQIKKRHEHLKPILDERQYRLYLAAEAEVIGRGGVLLVSKATGASRNTITSGISELSEPQVTSFPETIKEEKGTKKRRRGGRVPVSAENRIRKPGGGRKRTTDLDTTLKSDLEALLEPFVAGDPCSPLRWTCKSVRSLTDELTKLGHKTSTRMVHELLIEMRYTMQGNRKTKDGGNHPDRNEQFLYINNMTEEFQERGQPVISVDSKKKELIGQFANKGATWRPQGCPEEVNVHDFIEKENGRATPYGIHDINNNLGFVNVGTGADTAEFAVESICRWWISMGKECYPEACELFITADGGGSNGLRVRLWKQELQKFANETGLKISVSHFPPGTSKWNKIEHRMFSYISQNWRGKPLVSIETIVNLIGATKTKKGLKINTAVDVKDYERGRKITDEEMGQISLERCAFHGEWNYAIHPQK